MFFSLQSGYLERVGFWTHQELTVRQTPTSEMAIELPEGQVKGEDLVGELLKSLYGTRKAAHNW